MDNESNAAESSTNSDYALDNAGREASSRFDALAAMYDPGTIRHLEERGVSSGWQCLEVGGANILLQAHKRGLDIQQRQQAIQTD